MNSIHHAASRFVLGGIAAAAGLIAPEAQARTNVSVGISLGTSWPHSHPAPYCAPVVQRPYCPPPRGCFVRELPRSCVSVSFGRSVYYRYENVYYQPCSTGYVVVEPPPPTVIYTNPAPVYQVVNPAPAPVVVQAPAPAAPDYHAIWVGNVEYEIRDGQFFRRTYEGSVWSEPPFGAITSMLPVGHKSVWFKEVEYFECESTYYRKTPEGYKVIPAPWKS